jgi:hypothetical protein
MVDTVQPPRLPGFKNRLGVVATQKIKLRRATIEY